MTRVAAVLLLLFGFLAPGFAPALAGEGYSLENRPAVVFKGGVERMTPYPQGKRSTSVWVSDSCFRGCNSSCAWKMEYCLRGDNTADTCRPHLDNCTRACQRNCGRWGGPWGGPLAAFVDWY